MRPVAYGYPGPELWEASDRGEVVLGGCISGSAASACPACAAGSRETPPLAPFRTVAEAYAARRLGDVRGDD